MEKELTITEIREETRGILLAACYQANRLQHSKDIISLKEMIDRHNMIIGVKDKIVEGDISNDELIAAYEVLIEQLLSI